MPGSFVIKVFHKKNMCDLTQINPLGKKLQIEDRLLLSCFFSLSTTNSTLLLLGKTAIKENQSIFCL
jgi:hypothetical protein